MSNRGFTLIEVIVVIVAIGIVSSIAVPAFQDLGSQAKSSACRQSLMSIREGIDLWRANNIARSGNASYPPIDTLRLVGGVIAHDIPPNPFQQSGNAPDSIVTGVTKGVVVGTRGGWAYKASTGQIWPNTNSTVSGSGCAGTVSVGENSW
jgi:prepilin-type N-terminal cleavage/methylation domain-containing protein